MRTGSSSWNGSTHFGCSSPEVHDPRNSKKSVSGGSAAVGGAASAMTIDRTTAAGNPMIHLSSRVDIGQPVIEFEIIRQLDVFS
jgi:hypothetical protein